ncbi:MAG: hypothetical protein HY047_03545 [Acidobacteria bacterium]|nr:hypothetical protein [Acidobacteriota bacterium]
MSRALRNRFEAIRQAEIERLEKKLRGLSENDRRSVEAITADIIAAIACVPERALATDVPHPALEALVRLFALEHDRAAAQ